MLASTYLEKERGFWTAYLLALSSSWIGLALLVVFKNELGMQLQSCYVDTSLTSSREVSSKRWRLAQECGRHQICYSKQVQA